MFTYNDKIVYVKGLNIRSVIFMSDSGWRYESPEIIAKEITIAVISKIGVPGTANSDEVDDVCNMYDKIYNQVVKSSNQK
jgi:hypothetical protein